VRTCSAVTLTQKFDLQANRLTQSRDTHSSVAVNPLWPWVETVISQGHEGGERSAHSQLGLFHQFKFAWFPSLVKPRLQRTVEA
jgi:hypothetical protein